MSDTFCVIPWTQLAVKPNGSVRTCCLMSNSPVKEKGQIGFNLGKDSVYDGWNSSLQTSIRKDLLDGIQNINCKTCWEKEKVGLSSFTYCIYSILPFINLLVKIMVLCMD